MLVLLGWVLDRAALRMEETELLELWTVVPLIQLTSQSFAHRVLLAK